MSVLVATQGSIAAIARHRTIGVLSDTFNRSDGSLGTANIGGTWVALTGTWSIASNQAKWVSGTNAAVAMLPLGTSIRTGAISTDVYMSGTAGQTGLVFRGTDQSNCYFVQLVVSAATNAIVLYKVLADSYTILAQVASGAGLVNGYGYTLAVTMTSTTITVYVNGVSTLTYTILAQDDIDLPNGRVGIRTFSTEEDGNSRWDNLWGSTSMALPQTIPAAPLAPVATSINATSASVTWFPAGNGGSALTSYRVTSSHGEVFTGISSAATSYTCTGLTSVAQTFTVTAINTLGSRTSNASNSVTPSVQTWIRGPDPSYTPTGYNVLVQPGQLDQNLLNTYAGQVIALAPGIHRMPSRLQVGSGSQLLGFPGAVVSGAKDISTGWTQYSTNVWWIGGQSEMAHMNLVIPGLAVCGINGLCQDTQDVYYDKQFLWPVGSIGAVTAGTFFFDYGAGRIYIGNNPAGHTIETPAFTNIYTDGDLGMVTAQGSNTIRNIVFECAGTGWEPFIKLFNNSTLRECTVRLSHMQGVGGYSGSQMLNTIVAHNGQLGIAGWMTLVDNCEISYSNELGFFAGFEAGGGKYPNYVTGTEVRNCWIHHNLGDGFWFDTSDGNNRVHHNTFEYNGGAGQGVEACTGVNGPILVYNNIFRYNGASQAGLAPAYDHWWVYQVGLNSGDTNGLEAYGNYFYGNACGPFIDVRMIDSRQVDTNLYYHDNYAEFSGTPNGNIMYNGSDYSAMLYNHCAGVVDPYGSFGTTAATTTYTNNHYYCSAASAGVGAAYFAWGSTTQTFSQWQAEGHDTGGSIQSGNIPTVPSGVGAPSNR